MLVLLASSGMMLLAAARDLMIVFLGIELMSISVYALAGINRRSERSAEGALKYFLLGAFSTAFLLYGIALVYGATGTTNLDDDRRADRRSIDLVDSPLLAGRHRAAAGRLRLQGRDRAVPHVGAGRLRRRAVADHGLHGGDGEGGGVRRVPARVARGVPDELSDAGTRRSAGSRSRRWSSATRSASRRRISSGMLAYSSIGHAGYLLVAIAAGTLQGSSAMLFYLFVYTLATFGAFAVVVTLTRDGQGTVMLDELAGLWTRAPVARARDGGVHAGAARLPDLRRRGFFAKWYVLQAALQAPVQADDARRRARAHDRRVGGLLPVRGDGDVHAAARRTTRRRPSASGGLDAHRARRQRRADPVPRRRPRTLRVAHRAVGRPDESSRAADVGDRGAPMRRDRVAAERRARADARRGRARGPVALSDDRGHGHRRRNLSAVRHPRHRRQGSDDRGRARASAARTRRTSPSTAVRGAVAVGRDNRPSGGVLRDALVDGLTERRRRRRRHRRRADAAQLLGAAPSRRSSAASRSPARTIRPSTTDSSCRVGTGVAARRGDPASLSSSRSSRARRRRSAARCATKRSSTATSTTSSQRIGPLARPMRVVYDCGNGAGALVAPQLFARLGVDGDAACSARATARFRTTIPIRRSPRTSRI